jgi:hypothetical protein
MKNSAGLLQQTQIENDLNSRKNTSKFLHFKATGSNRRSKTHSIVHVTSEDMALEQGGFSAVAMAACESKAAFFCRVRRSSSTEQNSVYAIIG